MSINTDMKLRIKLFNYVDIQCNGQSIFKEKQLTAKLKSLLQYFIINKGVICKPEKIIEELWPDNEYIERKKVLQTYVHRLRNALSKDNLFDYDFSKFITIVNNKGNYQMDVSPEVELDTELLLSLTRKAHTADTYEELMALSVSMAKIYDGHYLQDSQHEQLIMRQQNYYLQAYCGAMVSILTTLETMGEYNDVIALCENFFAIEDLDDSINILFIHALIKTQQITYAIRHYGYIEKKMFDTFDVPPSEELTSLYRSIKANQGGANPPTGTSPYPGGTDGARIEESRMKNLIHEIISEQMKESKAKYSFAKIDIITPKTDELPVEVLESVLIRSLRKNDMFTLITDKSAMALLFEAREEYFENIIDRIVSYVNRHYPELEAKVEVAIWPITNIV